jgi:hypothetical protein
MKRLLISFLFFSFWAESLNAQNLNFYGLFPVYNQNGLIYKKLDYSLFFFGAINTFEQKIENVSYPSKLFIGYGEAALSYNFTSRFSAAFAYVYERQHPFDSYYRNENRLYQQLTYKHPVSSKATLKHRLRFDERFVQNRSTGETPLTHRLRYLIGIEFPLKKESDQYYFTAYNEFFFNTFTPRDAFYGENWAYAGIGLKTKKVGKFEAGPIYINWVRNAAQDRLNLWYLQLSWITQINLTKNQQAD